MKFFNNEITFIIFGLLIGLAFNVSLKYSTNQIYYKNKYYDYGDEPVLLEKSTREKDYIKPNIIVPRYKLVSKTVDERAIPDLNASMSTENISPSNTEYVPTASSTSSTDSESELEFDSNPANKHELYKNYKDVSIIDNGEIIKPKSLFSLESEADKQKESKKEDSLKEKFTDNKNKSTEGGKKSVNKLHQSQQESSQPSNIYFAEDDLDYLVSKKIRESTEKANNDFTKISINKESQSQQKNNKEKQQISGGLFPAAVDSSFNKDTQEKWKSKLQILLEELKHKILDNPKDYDFYFKDCVFEFKQELIANNIIKPNSYHLDIQGEFNKEKQKDFEKLEKLEEKYQENLENKQNSLKISKIGDKTSKDNNNNNNSISSSNSTLITSDAIKERREIENLLKKEENKALNLKTHDADETLDNPLKSENNLASIIKKLNEEISGLPKELSPTHHEDKNSKGIVLSVKNDPKKEENTRKTGEIKNKLLEKIKQPRIEKLNVVLKDASTINSVKTNENLEKKSIKSSSENKVSSKKIGKEIEIENIHHAFKFKESKGRNSLVKEDVDNKSLLSELLQSLN